MPENDSNAEATEAVEGVESGQGTAAGTSAAESAEHPGEAALGDAGKKALDSMKAERNAARSEVSELRRQFEALQAQVAGTEKEHAAAVEAQRVKDEALAKANDRIRRAEVRAQAAAKLADPTDALKFLDLDSIEVGDDGEVDADAVGAAIDQLISDKPYLAAQGRKFQGNADAGARNDAVGPQQLTRDDLGAMTPAEIVQADADGRLEDLKTGKA